jgi:hypothetical protein
MSRLRYHQATFDLLGREPVVSPRALARIEEVERSCGCALPAAVKEWYSLDDASLLRRYKLEGEVRSLDAVLADLRDTSRPGQGPSGLRRLWASVGGHFPLSPLAPRGRLPISAENDPRRLLSGVRLLILSAFADEDWGLPDADTYVRGHGSDDPPVLLVLPEREVVEAADTFSSFVFVHVWVGLTLERSRYTPEDHFILRVQDPSFGPMELDYLRDTFTEGTVLHAGVRATRFHFHQDNIWIEVALPGEGSSLPAELRIAAGSLDELVEAVRRLWPCCRALQTDRSWTASKPGQLVWRRLSPEAG